nr:hypothetical protein [Rhodoferax sp.]
MINNRKHVDPALTLWDRLVYGSIAAMFGLVIGCGSALLAFFAVGHSSWNIVLFSAVFFFLVGFVRGAFVGDFVGDTLTLLFGIGATEVDVAPTDLKGPQGRLAIGLIVVYAACVLVLVGRA